MRLPSALLLALLLVSPVRAGETGWQEFAPDTRVRLITADVKSADGTVRAAIELQMPEDTKTYWRVPGETGIPTRLDLAGSDGVGAPRLYWPYPRIEEAGGYTDYVYYGPLVIPFEIEVTGDAPVIRASLLMGICSDICVPAMADFTLPVDLAKPDGGNGLRIDQAFANVPIPWDGAGDPVSEVALDATEPILWVTLDDPAIEPASIIADASEAGYLLGAPQKSREAGVIGLPLIGDGDGADLVDKSIKLVFMTQNGPYEVSRPVRRSTAP